MEVPTTRRRTKRSRAETLRRKERTPDVAGLVRLREGTAANNRLCYRACDFQILDPLEFLAEFTQHIPPKGSHLIRYYGWYSNKARGMRRKAAEAAEQAGAASSGDTPEVAALGRASQTWAMLIKRVYEIDPLCCPKCQGQMKVIAFREPPQADVIEKILRHCGLWHATRAPPAGEDLVHGPDGQSQADFDKPRELVFAPKTGSGPRPSPTTRPTTGFASSLMTSPGT